jgi:high-affinity iron transporter
MRLLKWLEWTLLVTASIAAHAGDVTGRVLLSGRPAPDAVVSIEGLRQTMPRDRSVQVIDHRDLQFIPRLLIGRVGMTVQFKNGDGMPCRIYSASRAGVFVVRGEQSNPTAITFEEPGVIQVRCAQHPAIRSFVIIKENSYYARTDSKGRYRISSVPPGRYTLQAWHDGDVVGSNFVEIKGGRLTIDFRGVLPQATAALAGEFSLEPSDSIGRQKE